MKAAQEIPDRYDEETLKLLTEILSGRTGHDGDDAWMSGRKLLSTSTFNHTTSSWAPRIAKLEETIKKMEERITNLEA